MEEVNYSKKQLILSLGTLALVLGVTLVAVILTSIIWVPLLIVASPFLVILALLIKFTSIGAPF